MKSSIKQAAVAFGFLLVSLMKTQAQEIEISNGWQLQDIDKVADSGHKISKLTYITNNWYKATVPGTVLTSLVNNKVYPEPLYGENNRPDKISEHLCRTSYWYRSKFFVPKSYEGKRIWINFDGINYKANVWINGKKAGEIKGAFARGIFDITSLVTPNQESAIAIEVSPQPNPGIPQEHTIANGMGKNGWYTGIDGPTFLCSIGWDWIPAIRDRNTGIWQKVYLSTTGLVKIKNPFVKTDLQLPDTTNASITIQTTVANNTSLPQKGVLKGYFDNVTFQQPVELAPNSSKEITFLPEDFNQLNIKNPKLWWPNGYGNQALHQLHLSFIIDNTISDAQEVSFGIRKFAYSDKSSENLFVSVNGVPVICKGGCWGMDDAMKRLSYTRLEAQIKMHKLANYTMIRNWVGQSTSEDFYRLCDKYGIMLWDEFFQANPSDGPNPTDIKLYLHNVQEKILRFRNHPSIAIWCGRNEGHPPKEIDDSLIVMMSRLDGSRLFQSSSTDGRGVNSGGPYKWRPDEDFYTINEAFKTETGSVSVPTLESIHGMMPQKDWEEVNDDWAEHDFTKGAQNGGGFRNMITDRYGKVKNLADFVRKSQLADYDAFRAMYEGRFSQLFNPVTGVLTWMSHPAQPSFVWQLYHYDLEPNSALFAVKKACEPIHIQYNEKRGIVQIVNTKSHNLDNLKVHISVTKKDGTLLSERNVSAKAAADRATDVEAVELDNSLCFIKLELFDSENKLLSDNFYWKTPKEQKGNLRSLDSLPTVSIDITAEKRIENGTCYIDVVLHNPSQTPALMSHLQLRKGISNNRVLPVYYTDNYVSLLKDETKKITIEASLADLKSEEPLIVVDGWNIAVNKLDSRTVNVKLNEEAQVSHWPQTVLPFSPFYIP